MVVVSVVALSQFYCFCAVTIPLEADGDEGAWACDAAQGDDPAQAVQPQGGRVQLRDRPVGADHRYASLPEHGGRPGGLRRGEQERAPGHSPGLPPRAGGDHVALLARRPRRPPHLRGGRRHARAGGVGDPDDRQEGPLQVLHLPAHDPGLIDERELPFASRPALEGGGGEGKADEQGEKRTEGKEETPVLSPAVGSVCVRSSCFECRVFSSLAVEERPCMLY